MMNAAELADFWASRSDDALRVAGREIETYNELGQHAIAAELASRGIVVDDCVAPADSGTKAAWISGLIAIGLLLVVGLTFIAYYAAPALLAILTVLVIALVFKVISVLAVVVVLGLLFLVLARLQPKPHV